MNVAPAMLDPYRGFLEAKVKIAQPTGLACELSDLPTHLLDGRPIGDHQRAIAKWGINGGCRAIFAAFGLGKGIIQQMILDYLRRAVGGRCLIVAPLGVRREFMRDAALLGTRLRFVRSDAEIAACDDDQAIFITNYESVRDGKITPSDFTAVSLDEASVLRSYGSKTFQTFLPLFDQVPYRFVATATPSPNRYKELIHYAGFLGVMDTGQALTRFFQRNPEKANGLTLYPHKEAEFWLWLNSWAVFLQKPSDLGFSDEGYDLPELTVRYHVVQTDLRAAGEESNGQHRLIRDNAMGIVQSAREKRGSLGARVAKAAELVAASPADHFLIWHDLEDERRALETAIPEMAAVYGSQDLDAREAIIERFAEGESRLLGAKPVMLGSGTNLQRHCHREIFTGIGHKFNDFIQAIHRLQRFQQPAPVEVDIIYSETEAEVLRDLQEKWARDEELRARMSDIIREYGLNHAAGAEALRRSIGLQRHEESGAGWRFVNNDCVDETRRMGEGTVDLVVTSIPFSNHYEYTPSYNDFGHTDDDDHFFAQLDFLTPELKRVLAPGRMACIHVKDRIMFGNVTGQGLPTVNPFHAKCIAHYIKHGFQYCGLIHVNTDVVRENNGTYRLSYSEMLKDGTKMGVGSPEYILMLRKPQSDRSRGYADRPVVKSADDYSLARWQIDAHASWRSSGDRLPMPGELHAVAPRFSAMPVRDLVKAFREQSRHLLYDYEAHIAIGETIEGRPINDDRGHLPRTFMAIAPGSNDSSIWDDVNRMRTLNTDQVRAGREKHVCPLQFDIVDRCINRFSMPGETVFDPFAGIGTVPLRALKMGRVGMGVELNADEYFPCAVRFLREAEADGAVPTLFNLLGLGEAA